MGFVREVPAGQRADSLAPVAREDAAGDAKTDQHGAGRPVRTFRSALRAPSPTAAQGDGGQTGARCVTGATASSSLVEPEPLGRKADAGGWERTQATNTIDRVLIGCGTERSEVRIRIGTGALAGAEIRLTCVPGARGVEAQLLTSRAGSRKTLSVAMEHLRARLRDKGIVLSAAPLAKDPQGPSAHGARTRRQER